MATCSTLAVMQALQCLRAFSELVIRYNLEGNAGAWTCSIDVLSSERIIHNM